MPIRRIDGTAPRLRGPEPQAPSVAGLAACLALLELEARALGHPLAAMLLAAAGEALRERPAGSECPSETNRRTDPRDFPDGH